MQQRELTANGLAKNRQVRAEPIIALRTASAEPENPVMVSSAIITMPSRSQSSRIVSIIPATGSMQQVLHKTGSKMIAAICPRNSSTRRRRWPGSFQRGDDKLFGNLRDHTLARVHARGGFVAPPLVSASCQIRSIPHRPNRGSDPQISGSAICPCAPAPAESRIHHLGRGIIESHQFGTGHRGTNPFSDLDLEPRLRGQCVREAPDRTPPWPGPRGRAHTAVRPAV